VIHWSLREAVRSVLPWGGVRGRVGVRGGCGGGRPGGAPRVQDSLRSCGLKVIEAEHARLELGWPALGLHVPASSCSFANTK